MFLESLGLSVWITNSEGEALPEYEVKQTDNETMECWVPSVEGTNFRIRWSAPKESPSDLDLMCYPSLDGVELDGYRLPPDKIADGEFGEIRYHATSNSIVQLYEFGKRELTDRDEDHIIDATIQRDLNTIRAELVWGRAGTQRPVQETDYFQPQVVGPINEKLAKKGHSGSAGLGNLIDIELDETTFDFEVEPSMNTTLFIFRYAPREWLMARDIIPRSQSQSPDPIPYAGQKRPRNTSPEIIDIEDTESEDDDIVILKHLVPVPVGPKQKRPKSQLGVKKEQDDVPRLKTEDQDNTDISPQKGV